MYYNPDEDKLSTEEMDYWILKFERAWNKICDYLDWSRSRTRKKKWE